MTHLYKNFMSVAIVAIILMGFFSVNIVAYDAADSMKSFISSDNRILCIAHRGDWHSFPENSAQAVNAAREYDLISVDVKVTSDSEVVLMADETIDRMCTDEDGKAVTGLVSSFTLDQLKSFYLRESNGSADKERTDCRVASLENALEAVDNESVLILNIESRDVETVYKKVISLNSTDKVIFRINDSMSKILDSVRGLEKCPTIIGNYQGNIIFMATNAVKECFSAGYNTIELGSANGHGVLYDNFLMKRFKNNGRAMVSMVNGRCGKRTDNETGWDDLISRGYSVIETDYPKELTEYISRLEASASELERYVDLYKDTDLTPFTTDTENALKAALANSSDKLNCVSSLSELDNARYSLQASHDKLKTGAKKTVTLAFNFSSGRIAVAVLCASALIISQAFLFKRRKKN